MKKLANVIKVNKKLINDIAKKVVSVLDLHSEDLKENPEKEIIIAQYYFNDKHVDIYLKHSGRTNSIGSYVHDRNTPKIYLYSNAISSKDIWPISQFLLHEITHFIDYQYYPLYSETIDRTDPFIDDFIKILNSRDGFGKIYVSKPESTVEELSSIALRKITNSSKFKQLLHKHKIKLDNYIRKKLLYILLNHFISDSYRMMSSEGKQHILGLIDYYNSDAEMKAYTNEIVNEMLDLLKINDISYYDPLELLYESDTYLDISRFLFPKNKKKILYEVGKAIIEYNSNLSTNPIWDKYTKNLNGQEHFQFRYLNKLYNENVEKFEQLAKDKEYLIKYKNLIGLVIKMNFEKKKLDMAARKMQEMAV